MFLRKWKLGQMVISLLVAAFLVLGGINVMGLVQGEKAIEEAAAIKLKIKFVLLVYDDKTEDCKAGIIKDCLAIIISWGSTSQIIKLNRRGAQVDTVE